MPKKAIKSAERYRRKLKAARAAKDLSQEAIAKRFRIDRSSYSRWENNIDLVSFGNVKLLCKILDIDITDLIE
ncbi:MAG: helix-turn-helix transcriptional regulator [Ruminococcus sp.]|nr:helix-turn-helix transcriptional regulator [Ruminococcus sp.]